jgi:hypothetical protein
MTYIPRQRSTSEAWQRYCSTRRIDPGQFEPRIRATDFAEIGRQGVRLAGVVALGVILSITVIRVVDVLISAVVGSANTFP